MYDLIVVGNGIAANLFLIEYFRQKGGRVLQIHTETLCPSSSKNNTGTIFLHGIKQGVSPLGDLIVRSFNAVSDYIQEEKPPGVDSAYLYHLCSSGRDNPLEFMRRYGSVEQIETFGSASITPLVPQQGKIWQGFIVDLPPFFNYLEQKKITDAANRLDITEDLLVGVESSKEGVEVSLLGQHRIDARKLILCTGAYTKLFEKIYPVSNKIAKSKVVPGAYLEHEGINLGKDSFSLQIQGHALVYHAGPSRMTIGATRQKDGVSAPDVASLKTVYQSFKELIKEDALPPFDDFLIKQGLRHKGERRMPFWGHLEGGIYGFFSLYRNGFSFPFLGAKELASLRSL
jgi:hypothetical protein